jgi:hypothetical protein
MRVSPKEAARFVLSAAAKAPRGIDWNVHCRDFVAKSTYDGLPRPSNAG